MITNDFPCKNCENRHYNCHAKCEEYQKLKKRKLKETLKEEMA